MLYMYCISTGLFNKVSFKILRNKIFAKLNTNHPFDILFLYEDSDEYTVVLYSVGIYHTMQKRIFYVHKISTRRSGRVFIA